MAEQINPMSICVCNEMKYEQQNAPSTRRQFAGGPKEWPTLEDCMCVWTEFSAARPDVATSWFHTLMNRTAIADNFITIALGSAVLKYSV